MGAAIPATALHGGAVGGERGRGGTSPRRLGARGGAGRLSAARRVRGVCRGAAGDDRSPARRLSAARPAAGAIAFRLVRLRAGCAAPGEAGLAEVVPVVFDGGVDHGRRLGVAVAAGEADVGWLVGDELIGGEVVLDALEQRLRQLP